MGKHRRTSIEISAKCAIDLELCELTGKISSAAINFKTEWLKLGTTNMGATVH